MTNARVLLGRAAVSAKFFFKNHRGSLTRKLPEAYLAGSTVTVFFCTAALLLAMLAFWQRMRWAPGLTIGALIILVAAGSGLIPEMMLSSLQIGAPLSAVKWSPHSSIVILGAGTLPAEGRRRPSVPFFGFSRVAVGAQAYFACRQTGSDCNIIVSGGDPQRHGAAEAVVYGQALRALQVPSSDVILESRSNNTWQNAQNSTALVGRDRSLIVVTSGFQLKRALLYFSHFRPNPKGVSSDELGIDLGIVPTSVNLMATDALIHEQIGITRYYLYNALGWNTPKAG